MFKNIIIEGVECSGKTTLINEIRKKIPGWDLKFLGHKPIKNQYDRFIHEYSTNTGTIFNRAHYSEEFYSLVWNRGSSFSIEEKKKLDNKVRFDSLLVLVLPPSNKIMIERYLERDFTQQVNVNELEKVSELFYEKIYDMANIKYISKNINSLNLCIEELKIKLNYKG